MVQKGNTLPSRATKSSAPTTNSAKQIKQLGTQDLIIGFFTEMFGD
jgi:hypothetical protein